MDQIRADREKNKQEDREKVKKLNEGRKLLCIELGNLSVYPGSDPAAKEEIANEIAVIDRELEDLKQKLETTYDGAALRAQGVNKAPVQQQQKLPLEQPSEPSRPAEQDTVFGEAAAKNKAPVAQQQQKLPSALASEPTRPAEQGAVFGEAAARYKALVVYQPQKLPLGQPSKPSRPAEQGTAFGEATAKNKMPVVQKQQQQQQQTLPPGLMGEASRPAEQVTTFGEAFRNAARNKAPVVQQPLPSKGNNEQEASDLTHYEIPLATKRKRENSQSSFAPRPNMSPPHTWRDLPLVSEQGAPSPFAWRPSMNNPQVSRDPPPDSRKWADFNAVNDLYPTVVPSPDGTGLVELYCSICKRTRLLRSRSEKQYAKIRKMTTANAVKAFTLKVLSQKEMEEVQAGTYKLAKLDGDNSGSSQQSSQSYGPAFQQGTAVPSGRAPPANMYGGQGTFDQFSPFGQKRQ
ncbi:hypothetical protein KC347_g4402 [Hortaea werneckii]|nr:hypothetical protein KC347_g4402 [Hortaea werneckii]